MPTSRLHERATPVAVAGLLWLLLLGPGTTTAVGAVVQAGGAPQGASGPEGLGVLPPVLLGSDPLQVTGSPLDRTAVAAALRPVLRGGALGPGRSPAHVVDVASGAVLYSAAGTPTVPASTMKLVTATSVLDAMGPDQRLRTRVVLTAATRRVPRVVIVGSGDPSLSSTGSTVGSPGDALVPSSLPELAADVAVSLERRSIGRIRVGYDDSLFSGPSMHPSWATSFPAEGVVAPVSALQVDQGRATPTSVGRTPDPAARAGRVFADALRAQGVQVTGTPKAVTAPIGASTLAFVESPPVGVLVERTLAASDNGYAESLGRLGALAGGEPASFRGVARRAESLLESLGARTRGARFADASGLSRRNRLAPATLTDLLRTTAAGYGSLHSGLPVAAGTGSLATRFVSAGQRAGRGVVRAKTGTLRGVVGLAGYASRPDGRLLAFAFVDDSATGGTFAARSVLDRAAAVLVACDCVVASDEGRVGVEPPTP